MCFFCSTLCYPLSQPHWLHYPECNSDTDVYLQIRVHYHENVQTMQMRQKLQFIQCPLEAGCKWVNSNRLLWSVFTSICNVCVFWRQIIRSAPWDLCPIFRSESEVLGSSSTHTGYGCSMLTNHFAVIVLADNLEDVRAVRLFPSLL